MANQSEDSSVPSAQIVGNAFIQQFYVALHKSPEQVHKFYLDSSVLSRPGADGALTSATTIQGINDMILSLDHQNYHTEIVTADAQFSYKDGVIVLVTGCLNGNNVRRKFTQSFFLFPQDKRYYVLNDIFRYVDDETSNDPDGSSSTLPLTPSIESTEIADQPIPSQTVSLELEDTNDGNEVIRALDNGKESVAEEISVVEENGITENNDTAEKPADLSQNVAPPVPEAAAPLQETASLQEAAPLQEDAPKKSFASVVYALNKNMAPFHVRAAPPKPVEQQPRAPAVPEPPAPSTNNVVESTNDLAATAKAFAIFVANLPMSATVEELDKVFKEFGPIKRDGIQVRSNKGTCFGFVEFESLIAMQNALEASPIVFGNRKLSIEERRANNDRGRFSSGRSGYRNDNFRGRGSRGYGRNEFEKRGEFSGRARANSGHNNGEPQQRAYPNGGGKVARQAVQVA